MISGVRLLGLLSVLAGVGLGGAPVRAQGPVGHHVKASLLSETDGVVPGRPLTLGIRLVMEKGWHTYWRNPGDSGLATRARWELPPGFSAGEIQWPYPVRFETGPIVSYGYEDEVLLPVAVEVPRPLEASVVRLGVRVSWLECQEACLPGKTELSLDLPVKATGSPSPEAELFAKTRERLPSPARGWRITAAITHPTVAVTLWPPRGTTVQRAYLYPVTPRLVDYSQPQPLRRNAGGWRLDLPRDPNGTLSGRLTGVLVAQTGRGTVALDVDTELEGAGGAKEQEERR
jgi:DsbC/DsbD-like thiol-disulfide interchange protein